MAGWSASNVGGGEVFGASVGLLGRAAETAAYELWERFATLAAFDEAESFLVKTHHGQVRRLGTPAEVFPKSPRPESWVYSLSNGTALASTWTEACHRARRERLERDTVLRSWYWRDVPMRKTSPSAGEVSDAYRGVSELYSLEMYELERRPEEAERVAIAFLFAKDAALSPQTIWASGAGEDSAMASTAALKEALQRLAFLWEGDIDPAPDFAPTAGYHQEVYLGVEGAKEFHRWIAESQSVATAFGWANEVNLDEETFADLTPAVLSGQCYVARSLAARYPLFFGRPHVDELPWVTELRILHPVA